MYHKNRILMTALTAICLAPLNATWAYPPTPAGLQQLVRDDEKMLPAAFAASLGAEQHDWEAHCKSNAHALPHCEQDLAAGQITYYQSKIFWSHGFLFGPLDWNATLPLNKAMLQRDYGPLDALPGNFDIHLSQSIPQIIKPLNPSAKTLNAAIRTFIGSTPKAHPHSYWNEDYSLDYHWNADALPNVISISVNTYDYVHGTPHGEFGGQNFNWNVSQKRLLQPDDLFDDRRDWQNGLAAIVFAKLTKGDVLAPAGQPKLVLFEGESPTKIRFMVVNTRSWVPAVNGLIIAFPLYGVTQYNYGCPSVLVPWAELAPYLAKGGLAPG